MLPEAAVRNRNQIPFSIAWSGTDRTSPGPKTRHAGLVRDVAAGDLNLGGYQVVFGCASFVGVAKLLVWAVLKLWVFEL
jgi:hypothetical protein